MTNRCYASPLENGNVRVVLTRDQNKISELLIRSYRGEIRSLRASRNSKTVYIAVPEIGIDPINLATRLNIFIDTEYEVI